MITVTFYYKNEHLVGFRSEGHAGYDDSGKDIICAGVSTLVFTTANSIESFTDDDISAEQDENNAFVDFLITSDKPSEKTEVLLNAFKLGIVSIAEGNSSYLNFTSKEV